MLSPFYHFYIATNPIYPSLLHLSAFHCPSNSLPAKFLLFKLIGYPSTATRMAARPSKRQICPPKRHPDGTSICVQLKQHYIKRDIAGCEGFELAEKQKLLELTSTHDRLRKGVDSLGMIIERIKINKRVSKIINGNGNLSRLKPAE